MSTESQPETCSVQALREALEVERRRVEARLDRLLEVGPEPLRAAMRYATLGRAKRIRPILCLWTQQLVEPEEQPPTLDAACALELVHTYSLIHDDLPCMDDDDLRRGRPSCHVQFGEAIAVLAGDALLARAFEVMAAASWPAADAARQALRCLAHAAGPQALVGGQALDLESTGQVPDAARVEAIHAAKTAALLRAAMEVGTLCGGAEDAQRERLGQVGEHLGMAFQIVDDLLDLEGSAATLGKTEGKDARAGKMTYPAAVGVDAARAEVHRRVEAARTGLAAWPRAGRLQALARYLETRLH